VVWFERSRFFLLLLYRSSIFKSFKN
jgi:hypothetical protein